MATRVTAFGTVHHDHWESPHGTLVPGDEVVVDGLDRTTFAFDSHAVHPDGHTWIDVIELDRSAHRSFRPERVRPARPA